MKIKAILSIIPTFIYFSVAGQVTLPSDTTIACGDSITIHAQTLLPTTLCTGSYEVDSIPFDPVWFSYSGTLIFPSNLDDYYSDTIEISFPFHFFNGNYNNVVCSSNGYITFKDSLANTFSAWSFVDTAPSLHLSPAAVFGVQQDIDQVTNGSIYFYTIGSSPNRKYCTVFSDVAIFACTNLRSSTAIVLYETSNIIDVYVLHKDSCPTWNHGSSLLGIQNMEKTIAYVPPGRNTGNWYADHEAWRFTPNEPCDSFYLQWYVNDTLIGTGDSLVVANVDTLKKIKVEEFSMCSGFPVLASSDEMLILPEAGLVVSPSDTAVCIGDSVQIIVSGVTQAIWSSGETTLQKTICVQNDTTFIIWSFDNPSCQQFQQSVITANLPPPIPNITILPQNLTLVCSAPNVAWYFEDSLIVIADSLEAFANGSYYAIVTDSNGCSSISNTIIVSNVGIDDITVGNIKIFPNPNDGNFTIDLNGIEGVKQIVILNIFGEVVYSETLQDNIFRTSINTSWLSNGCYYVVVKSDHQLTSTPLIISN